MPDIFMSYFLSVEKKLFEAFWDWDRMIFVLRKTYNLKWTDSFGGTFYMRDIINVKRGY